MAAAPAALGTAGPPAEPVATVDEVTGDVRVRRAGDLAWVAVEAGDLLGPSDTIQTMDDASAVLSMGAGGASATLQPGTTLLLPAASPSVTRLRHLSGQLRATLSPNERVRRMEVELPPGTLIVEPAAGQATADPLEARVQIDEGRTQIAMVRGRATLDRTEGESLPIEESRFVSVNEDGALVESGWTGPAVALLQPADGALSRTRAEISFTWAPSADVDGYQLEIAAGADATPTAAREVSGTEVSLELSSGNYRWTVRGMRRGEVQRESVTRNLTVELDRTPPPLQVNAPRNGQAVTTQAIWVRGSTEPGASATLDGRDIEVAADGSFACQTSVAPGLAHLVLRVTDDLGNARTVSRTVVRR